MTISPVLCQACGLFFPTPAQADPRVHGCRAGQAGSPEDTERVFVAAMAQFARAGERLGMLFGKAVDPTTITLTLTRQQLETWNIAVGRFRAAVKAYEATKG